MGCSETYRKYFCTTPDVECEHWQGTFCDLWLEDHLKDCLEDPNE